VGSGFRLFVQRSGYPRRRFAVRFGRRFAPPGVVFGADFAAFRRRRLGRFARLGAGCRPLRALSRFFSKRSQCLELVSGSKGMLSRSLKTLLPSSVTILVFLMMRICEGELPVLLRFRR